MRLTICIVLLCPLHLSLALPDFFPDPAVGDEASPSLLMNSAAEQPNTEPFQTFNNEQSDTKQPWADQSSFAISAPNSQSGYEISDVSKDCGRGAGAKFRKRASFCSQLDAPKTPIQEDGQQPVDNPKKPKGPEGPPLPLNHPGKPRKDYQFLPDFRWGVNQRWMNRLDATEDDDSDMCGKGKFVVCDSGNPYYRIPLRGTIYYALGKVSYCKIFFFFSFLKNNQKLSMTADCVQYR